VLPTSRAVGVNKNATAFATIINTGTRAATACALALPSGAPAATFSYQTTDPNTNASIGAANTPANIPAGASQTFVFSITPMTTFGETEIAIRMSCTSGEAVTPISGVNTFLLTSSSTPTPDVVALSATTTRDGVVSTPDITGTGAFSVATVNVGAAGTVTASVDTGTAKLPATFALCQTDAQAQCQQSPQSSVQSTFAANQTGTFSVFVTATGTTIAFDPANSRVFVRFKFNGGSVGSTSVAVKTGTGNNNVRR